MIRTKQDVETHGAGYGGRQYPAVNVKITWPWTDDARRATFESAYANAIGGPVDERAWAIVDAAMSGDAPERASELERAEEMACESGWDMAETDAAEVFGYPVKVWSAGRSGGWAIVDGLPDIESWDAVMLAKWRRWARWCRMGADGIPESAFWHWLANFWEAERPSIGSALAPALESEGVGL